MLTTTTSKVADLVWSMLISPDLFKDLDQAFNRSVEEFKASEGWDFLNLKVTCSKGVLNCTELMRSCGVSRDDEIKYATPASTPPVKTDPMDYSVPLCSDGTFLESQVLASFLDALVMHYWAEKSWVTDVESYDNVIPQTITMCWYLSLNLVKRVVKVKLNAIGHMSTLKSVTLHVSAFCPR